MISALQVIMVMGSDMDTPLVMDFLTGITIMVTTLAGSILIPQIVITGKDKPFI